MELMIMILNNFVYLISLFLFLCNHGAASGIMMAWTEICLEEN